MCLLEGGLNCGVRSVHVHYSQLYKVNQTILIQIDYSEFEAVAVNGLCIPLFPGLPELISAHF